MAASFDLHSLAVLGAAGERLVIWHVNVGASLGESRLSGAWVLEDSRVDEIRSLTSDFPVVLTGEGVEVTRAGEPGPVESSAKGVVVCGTAGTIDVGTTVETVCAEIEFVDARFTEQQDATGGKLTRPQWPVIVSPEEVALTDSQVDVVDDHIRPVLTLARGLSDLAEAWAAFESLRLARSFLVEFGGPLARPLPLAVR
ncbi:hypothetical protein [Nocardia seriolae]|uniref:Uncharacterized protein n=1 Tax=Nocardia seriolae TaxID=37332 RepID=A0ABC8AT30_9NOCA|nr:hypothetical protein [Nocardia seriolae]GEM24141.1 hypothetical protein NS2_23800 [Nocardia seriolae NBRC 15557]APA97295.1 hypothetical protein NS506_03242 [Nocardia seriolae]QUN18260.1 hypothetical protein KEC46_02010 [Nocardia seriolae]WKY50556.1 hypothetical protein Q5P07_26570 [Nocardia seriolae]WNJ61460.1 hypothetical protein RMO66_12675 [Nocardia seriolae]